MPEETRKGVESIKKGEIDKRKKVWEDKEGPPNKKQKKMTPAQEERGKIETLVFKSYMNLTIPSRKTGEGSA